MQMKKDAPIGIFDSGVGGLTVAKRIMELMPNEQIVYFGDTARAPYGIHTNERIVKQSKQILRFLTEKGVKCAVIACNTICAAGYDELAASFEPPLYSIIAPAAEECVETLRSEGLSKVGVIATEATVKSGAYEREIKKLYPGAKVYQVPCPELVVIAEAGEADGERGKAQIEIYLKELKEAGIDAIILGCTHFPLFTRHIVNYLGNGVKIIDPANAAAQKVKKELLEMQLSVNINNKPAHDFNASGDIVIFNEIAGNILQGVYNELVNTQKVDIEKY